MSALLPPPSLALLALASVAAVIDWIAVVTGRKGLEYGAKPAVLACLLGVAAGLDATDETQRTLVAVALVLSLVGDVYLMLTEDRFVEGLGAFLLAHIAFIGGLGREVVSPVAFAVAAAILAVATLPVGRRIAVGAAQVSRGLVRPVIAYMVVVGLMVATAIGSLDPFAAVGAGLFLASDAMLGWRRFVASKPWMSPFVIVTYHLGQAGLVLSLAV